METIYNETNEKTYTNYMKYEHNITKIGWVILVFLILEDVFAKTFLLKQPLVLNIIIFQGLLLCLFIALSVFKVSHARNTVTMQKGRIFELIKSLEIIVVVIFISTMYHSAFFYFVALLPITFISLTKGFKRTSPYILLSLIVQILSQYIVSTWLTKRGIGNLISDVTYLIIISIVQYVLFTLFCYIWSGIYNEYARSEEENNILIDRLGDKYVQLEQAKKEIQSHYDRQIESNNQLEEANNKLTSSLAEFYTLQQISQAITSIFDMNELLKFVNDVIIGVMGVSHSTIALCYGKSRTSLRFRCQVFLIKRI